MGWGTPFNYEIYLNRIIFNNVYQLKEAIEEKEKDIANIEAHIKMWASATPKDVFITEDDGSLLSAISFEVNEILAEYRDTLLILNDLRRYLEYVEDNKIDLTKTNETD